MALGVRKTYRKEYFKALSQYIAALLDLPPVEERALAAQFKTEIDVPLSLNDNDAFVAEVTPRLIRRTDAAPAR